MLSRLFTLALLAFPAGMAAQTAATDSIVAAADTASASAGTVTIIMPDALNARLYGGEAKTEAENPSAETDKPAAPAQTSRSTSRQGYRVQVFDDNNARTAKREAQARKSRIQSRFPEFNAYVSFNSPDWRVKVGDFTSRSEAEAALAAIRQAFPEMGSQLRIVRDRVNVR